MEHRLSGFKPFTQETPMSCGACAARMVLEYLGFSYPESAIRQKVRTSKRAGTLPWLLTRGMNRAFEESGSGYRLKMERKATLDRISLSLQNGLPVIVSLLVENQFRKGTLIGHYLVVTRIDHEKREIELANPFGAAEIMGFNEFEKAWEFDYRGSALHLPRIMKFAMALGITKPRTLFVPGPA